MNKRIALVCLLLAGSAGAALAADYQAGTLTIGAPWARATPPVAQTGAGFMTLTNAGSEDDTLLGAKAEVSAKVELHTHTHEDGVMKMRQVENIPVPANASTALEPGGLHVMFIGLHAPLTVGQQFPVTLQFAKAGEVTVEMSVQAGPQGAGLGPQHGQDMPMHGHGHGQPAPGN